jgi:hypothetical protein
LRGGRVIGSVIWMRPRAARHRCTGRDRS